MLEVAKAYPKLEARLFVHAIGMPGMPEIAR
jgi:hypothetical protein